MTYLEFHKKYVAPLHSFYVVFRKKFVLPVKYFFEGAKIVGEVEYPDPGVLLMRIAKLKNQLINALKRDQRAEAKVLEAQIKELEWVAYGKS